MLKSFFHLRQRYMSLHDADSEYGLQSLPL
jgi:hypothetical protein